MHASLDAAAHVIHGKGEITFVNTSNAKLYELWFHLYLNAFKNGRSRFLREPIGQFRGVGNVKSWGAIDVAKLVAHDGVHDDADLWPKAELHVGSDPDETDVRVPLPQGLPIGQSLTLTVEWASKLPSVVERTGFDGSYHFAGQWFPKLAKLEADGHFAHFAFSHLSEFYADYGKYDVTIDVPQGFTIGATGPAVETRDDGGRHIERHVQDNVHDFAFTAWDGFEKSTRKIAGVDVTMLAPRGMSDTAQRELAAIDFALPYFGVKYGAYPYPVLTVVHPPDTARETGGMEYPTLITTGGPFYLPRGLRIGEEVTVHELGHQWFYGLVATNENKYPFLDEGLNSYAEQDALARFLGPGSVADMFDLTLSDIAVQAVSSRFAVHDDKVDLPADEFATGFDYGRLVYGRTATIMESARRTWGEDTIDGALGFYTRDHRFAHPVPADLYAELSLHAGDDARHFCETALEDKGWVDFVVLSAQPEIEGEPPGLYDRNGTRETVPSIRSSNEMHHRATALIGRRGTLVMPVDIDLIDANGGKRRVRWDGHGDHFRVQWQGDAPLAFVVVDPDHAVLVDHNYLNNHYALGTASRPGAPRTLERAFYWAEALVLGAQP
jgi:hypothetical protein